MYRRASENEPMDVKLLFVVLVFLQTTDTFFKVDLDWPPSGT